MFLIKKNKLYRMQYFKLKLIKENVMYFFLTESFMKRKFQP